MKRFVLVSFAIIAVASVAGCAANLPAQEQVEVIEANPVHPLSWVENAIVNVDIEAAVANKDYRLLAFDGIRITVPGIASEELELAQRLCGVDYLGAAGDAISARDREKSAKDQELMNKALEYAYQYNREMLELCKLAHNS